MGGWNRRKRMVGGSEILGMGDRGGGGKGWGLGGGDGGGGD